MAHGAGDVIDDDFEIMATLGVGGFSEVFRVRRRLDGREYALKLFRHPRSEEAVRRELRVLQGLDHPNIVRVVWGGLLRDGRWYILTELVDGESLRSFTTEGNLLPVEQVIAIGDQLLAALESFHPDQARLDDLQSRSELTLEDLDQIEEAKGLVHRDIKPENLLLTAAGDVKLIDFNIASRVGSPVDTVSATYGYTPPGANLGEWTVDWDLFATGVVLYELLTAHHPFPNQNPNHPDGPIDPGQVRGVLPRALSDFLLAACASRAEERFATAGAMRAALIATRVRPTSAEPATMAPAVSRPTRAIAGRLDLFPDEHLPFGEANVLPFEPAMGTSPATQRRLPPAAGDQDHVIAGLRDLVEVNGPIRCNHLYRLYVEGSGDVSVDRVRKSLNRATHQAVRSGVLAQVEPLGGGQIDKTVYVPGTPAVVVRPLGDRLVSELPVSEIAARLADIDGGYERSTEEALRRLADAYGIEEGSTDHWLLTFLVNAAVEGEPTGGRA